MSENIAHAIKVYNKYVIGCVKNKAAIMISYQTKADDKPITEIIDLFLSQTQAEKLFEDLKIALKDNARQ